MLNVGLHKFRYAMQPDIVYNHLLELQSAYNNYQRKSCSLTAHPNLYYVTCHAREEVTGYGRCGKSLASPGWFVANTGVAVVSVRR